MTIGDRTEIAHAEALARARPAAQPRISGLAMI